MSKNLELIKEFDRLLAYVRNNSGSKEIEELIYEWYFCLEIKEIQKQREILIADTRKIANNDFLSEKTRIESSGWEVKNYLPNGGIVVRKYSKTFVYGPGEFIYTGSETNRNEERENKRSKVVVTHPEFSIKNNIANENSEDLWVFGKQRLLPDYPNWTRFYFNLKPDPNLILIFIELVSNSFNNVNIPFELKLRNSISSHYRPDAVILFLHRMHFFIASEVIANIYKTMTSLDAIDQWKPKFTKELAHGLSFGENPPNTYDSFGKYRAKTIARIIDINGLTKTNSSFIISNLKKIGFNIYELYRNPFVKVNEYKYRFDRIEKFLIGTKTIYQPQINFSKVLLPSNKYLMAARKIAYMICNEAIFYGDNFSWVYFKKQKDVYMFVNASDVDKYGIALFLKKVYTLFPFDSIFSEVSESIFLSYGINLNSVLEKFQNSISQPNGEIGVRESYEILRRSHYSNSMLADRIIERFKDFDIAFPNKYAKNWDDASGEEFNPTLTDGLAALGYFFLRLADNNDKVSELESLTYQKTLYKIRKVYN